MKAADWMRTTLIGALALTVAACASIGRPEGGPRDETPPEFVRSNPAPGSVNVDRRKVDILFNENIKIEDIANKLVISPAQKQNPAVSSNARHVTVELRDSLKPNTTYTFDFSDAIRDLNEGNILDGFALDFSTGPTIDTLRISGMVFEARTLEPAQGMVVGVYSELTDTTLTKMPFERVAKTNQYGQFTIRNLKPGTYHIFAVDDKNRDWHWDRSENIAFSSFTVSPSVEPVEVTDTLIAADGTDSIVARTAYRYLPDDLLLTWFNENYRPQYLREFERTDNRRVTFKFGTTADSLPDITVINGPRAGYKLTDLSVLETREGLDSIVYWIKDSLVVNQDSLLVSARYLQTDTLEQLSYRTDTLKLFLKGANRPKKEDKKKKEGSDTLPPPIKLLELKQVTLREQELNRPVTFEASEPIEFIDSAGWRLLKAVDTLWVETKGARLVQDTTMVRRYNLEMDWEPGARYTFTADSLSIRNIYGEWIKDFRHEFTVKQPEDYGNIIFGITDRHLIPDSAEIVVELLDKSDKPVQTRAIDRNGEVVFTFVNPDTYYARAFIDRNRNGIWDKGILPDSIQPEDVFYYPKKLTLRKNWDISQDWALFDTPVDQQKPMEIKRNKPKNMRPGEYDYGNEDNDEENPDDDSYFEQGAWGNGSQYNNANRNSNTGARRGGMQNVRRN